MAASAAFDSSPVGSRIFARQQTGLARAVLAVWLGLAVTGCGDSQPASKPTSAIPKPTTCAAPSLKAASPGDAADDATGRGQLFEQIELTGITDVVVDAGTGGLAAVDINHDGLTDLFAVSEEGGFPDALRLYLNKGCWQFEREAVELVNPEGLPEGNHAIPVFADFNNDGWLDFYLTGDPAMSPTAPTTGIPHPNMLFLARDGYRRYEEVGRDMGLDGGGVAYSRQSAVADVNGDGWLDIGVAADQIGDRTFRPGLSWQRLYIYQPHGGSTEFSNGEFVDIGGTDLIPGFGGQPVDDPEHDRASPGMLLRDIDGDGDIDLVQGYHDDMLLALWFHPNATGERHHGVYVWKNQLAESGEFRFVQELPGTGGLAEEGWSAYSVVSQVYEPVQHAVSIPYISAADPDNDDDLDILLVGPPDLEWHVGTDPIAGKFWRNQGAAGFAAATEDAGLQALNWTYDQWFAFWEAGQVGPTDSAQAVTCAASNQKPKCLVQSPGEHQFYQADAIWADFNNDGWLDLLDVDRRESDPGFGVRRNVLFLNRGDGTLEPVPTTLSGIDENSIAAEAADLNGDGLLDLYFMKDITNSSPFSRDDGRTPHSEFTDSVYWNTGTLGGRDNHWSRLRLTGLPQRQLIGSKLRLYAADGRLLGRRDLFPVTSYKTSVQLEAHFGLGQNHAVRLEVELPDGRRLTVAQLAIDALVEVDVVSGGTRILQPAVRQLDAAMELRP
ncbi:MAG: CRTAC1 family protein [Stagnimonas sp.]|nr:CRTAC1 family protein [Stagnimonas sp.]